MEIACCVKLASGREHLQRTLDIAPFHPRAGASLGRLLESQGRRQEAIGHYEHVGAAQLEAGFTQQAISTYRRLLRIQPESVLAHNQSGVALARLGRFDEAIGHFREALRLRPDERGIRANLDRAMEAQAEERD